MDTAIELEKNVTECMNIEHWENVDVTLTVTSIYTSSFRDYLVFWHARVHEYVIPITAVVFLESNIVVHSFRRLYKKLSVAEIFWPQVPFSAYLCLPNHVMKTYLKLFIIFEGG